MKKEQVYGVIVVFKEKELKFLLLQHEPEQYEEVEGNWSFPKGHIEDGEKPKQTALRELEEETGIIRIKILDLPLIHEEYEIFRKEEKFLKCNDYFIGFVQDKNVKIQEGEIKNYKWVTYKEAMKTFQYKSRKETLKTVNEYLKNMLK